MAQCAQHPPKEKRGHHGRAYSENEFYSHHRDDRLVVRVQRDSLIETECERRFRGNLHVASPREYLHTGAAGGADQYTDRRTFTAAGNRTDDGAKRGTRTHGFSGPLVLTQSGFALHGDVIRADEISATIHGDRLEVEHHLRIAGRTT